MTEHLIIDGGSTDGTVELLRDLSNNFSHIRWVSEKDKGQSDAMNKGLQIARGSWVGFLNADDFYESGILHSVIRYIQKDSARERILIGNLKVLNEKDELISVNKPKKMNLPGMLADVCEWPYNPSSYFYPACLHERIGKFPVNEHFAMDYDFILRLMVAKIPIDYYDEIWGNFRLLPDAKTGRDQVSDTSYRRAQLLREKYTAKAKWNVRTLVSLMKFCWAVRNKILGTRRKLMHHS
jgi:glycosyltransferase involved in cell wall biosynthesis